MTRPLAAVRGWLALVGSAALALQPLLGLLLLGVAAVVPRGLRWQRLRWAALLAAPLLLLRDPQTRQDRPIVLGAALLSTGQLVLGVSNATFGILPQTVIYAVALGYFLVCARRRDI